MSLDTQQHKTSHRKCIRDWPQAPAYMQEAVHQCCFLNPINRDGGGGELHREWWKPWLSQGVLTISSVPLPEPEVLVAGQRSNGVEALSTDRRHLCLTHCTGSSFGWAPALGTILYGSSMKAVRKQDTSSAAHLLEPMDLGRWGLWLIASHPTAVSTTALLIVVMVVSMNSLTCCLESWPPPPIPLWLGARTPQTCIVLLFPGQLQQAYCCFPCRDVTWQRLLSLSPLDKLSLAIWNRCCPDSQLLL